MALFRKFLGLLQDPPPDYVFELSEAGIAYVRPGAPQPAFEPLDPETIAVSPLADNVHRADALADKVRAITGAAGGRKRGRAVLILPDYCSRVAILEFDNFPTDPKEQLSLVRFRMKKSVPFDVESAAVSYHAQSVKSGTRSVEVVVVVAALEIVARYEAPFRAAGLHPGLVMTSVVPMSELNHYPGISIVARLNGRNLTVAVMNGPVLKLVRCVELHDVTPEEFLAVLFPTVAYIEDEMETRPARLLHCGFGQELRDWQGELGVPAEPLTSRYGNPGPFNAGLYGFLQSLSEKGGAKVA
jgi:type IV pilus assembly protein PilM